MRILGFIALCLGSLVGGADTPPRHIAELVDLTLESGEILREAKLGHRQAGTLNADKSNAILFPTWFTGTSEDLFTSGAVDTIDTERFFSS